jgi:D-alanyl-lipoteichoic acid acyltransferase DltB (MBOAT superfamily)
MFSYWRAWIQHPQNLYNSVLELRHRKEPQRSKSSTSSNLDLQHCHLIPQRTIRWIPISTYTWLGSTTGIPISRKRLIQDDFGGIMWRWQILFNFSTLRLISFNMDYYWSCHNGTTLEVWVLGWMIWLQKKEADVATLSDRDRIDYSCNKEDYSFLNYLAYVLYSPLYLAGPIITFNSYISQVCSAYIG